MTQHTCARFVVSLAVVMASASAVARAEQITILCSDGIKAVVEELVPKFEATTKHAVAAKFGLAAVLRQQIEQGAPFDVAILTPAAIDDLIKQGKIAASSRAVIAKTGLGLVVRAGSPKRDMTTVDAFKRTLLDAKSIAYAREGASGVAFAALIQRLGIADALEAKTHRTMTGAEVAALVTGGGAELGVLPVSEILPIRGAELLGTFPADAQTYITMVAGSNPATKAAAAREFVAFLTARSADAVVKAKGMER